MIAYQARTLTVKEPDECVDDPMHLQSIFRRHERPNDLAVTAASMPSSASGDASLISIIDPRVLGRESLARSLERTKCGLRSQTFACLGEWLRNDQIEADTAAILLRIGATDADDQGLAGDIQLLAREFGHIPTIVMGDIEDPFHVLKILKYGARGYIPTSVSLSVAVNAILLVRAGGLFVPASSLMQLQQHPPEQSPASAPTDLLFTERQVAVADAISRGKANKIIADELNLSESTVKVHVGNIMKKLHAHNRTEVAFKLHRLVARVLVLLGFVVLP